MLRVSLRLAADRFDAMLLSAFDSADSHGDEDSMKMAAESSWELYDDAGWGGGVGGDWEMGKMWAEKREIFHEQGKWSL
jgi:recyclin-1